MIEDISYKRYNILSKQYTNQFHTAQPGISVYMWPRLDIYSRICLYVSVGGIPYTDTFEYDIQSLQYHL